MCDTQSTPPTYGTFHVSRAATCRGHLRSLFLPLLLFRIDNLSSKQKEYILTIIIAKQKIAIFWWSASQRGMNYTHKHVCKSTAQNTLWAMLLVASLQDCALRSLISIATSSSISREPSNVEKLSKNCCVRALPHIPLIHESLPRKRVVRRGRLLYDLSKGCCSRKPNIPSQQLHSK